MFLIVPYGTDAPIYHWPRATVGLMAANTLIHLAVGNLDESTLRPFALHMGNGIHPLQWLTHFFLHNDFLHLFGNMVFLWTFGLIVEGKVGWWRFLGLYLGCGLLTGAFLQLLLLNVQPTQAVGASAAIYATMAMAMIWAPVNELNCFYLFLVVLRVFTGTWDLPIYGFALFFIIWEWGVIGLVSSLVGLTASSEIGHGTGALWGIVFGSLLVNRGWVDCENYDAYTLIHKRWGGLMKGRRQAKWTENPGDSKGKSAGKRKKAPRRAEVSQSSTSTGPTMALAGGLDPEQRVADAQRRIRRMLDQGMAEGALGAYRKVSATWQGWPCPEAEIMDLIKALHEKQLWNDSILPMRDAIARFPARATRLRLRLAGILVQKLERPTAGLRVLDEIDETKLTPDLAGPYRKLKTQAEAMRDEGVLELEGDD